jgi:hypothetical protein
MMAALILRFEPQTSEFASVNRSLPFLLRVLAADDDPPSPQFSFVVPGDFEHPAFQALKQMDEAALQEACLRWAVTRAEERLRSGAFPAFPTSSYEQLDLDDSEIPLIKRLMREKTCDYQVLQGRDLYCSAAAAEDKSVVAISTLSRLAPTSRPVCRGCSLPSTDFLCSHLMHPGVIRTDRPIGSVDRELISAYCDQNKPGIKAPSLCHPGQNECWERIVEPELSVSDSVFFSPTELLIAFDYLDVIWERRFKRPLLRLRGVEKTNSLSQSCATADEFRSRLVDLNEIFKLLEIEDDLLPENSTIKPEETFKRVEECLKKECPDKHGEIALPLRKLRDINTVRNKSTHGGAELVTALGRLGIKYPISSYASAWGRIRVEVADALNRLRKLLD